jgi:hypothetical protein
MQVTSQRSPKWMARYALYVKGPCITPPPVYHLYTTPIAALTCYTGTSFNYGHVRREHTSQSGRCSGQMAHRRPFTPSDPAVAPTPMSNTIHRSRVLPAICTTALGHSASRRHASPTRYPSYTTLRVIETAWLSSNGHWNTAVPRNRTFFNLINLPKAAMSCGGTPPRHCSTQGARLAGSSRIPLTLLPLCWSHF